MRGWGIWLAVGMFFCLQAGRAQAAGSRAEVFEANCSVCHGDDGAGSAVGKSMHAPDLRSRKVRMQPNAALVRFISEGKGGMPGFGGRLSAE